MRWGPKETKAERDAIRKSPEYRSWRTQVLKIQGGYCQLCGTSYRPLEVHHPRSFYVFRDLRLDPRNGLVVCDNCHAKIHGEVPPEDLEALDECKRWQALPIETRRNNILALLPPELRAKEPEWQAKYPPKGTRHEN